MQSISPTSLLLLAGLALTSLNACEGPESGPSEYLDAAAVLELDEPLHVELEAYEPGELIESDTLELLEADDDVPAQAMSCNLGFPSTVVAGPNKSGVAQGWLSGVAQGLYFFDAVRTSPQLLSNWVVGANNFVVAGLNQPSALFFSSGGTSIDAFLYAPPGALPGAHYDLQVRLYTSVGQLACTDTIRLEIPGDPCPGLGWWHQNPWPSPWFDSANCYVASLPQGVQTFIYDNNWYVIPGPGNSCAIGSYDGANCYIGSPPGGRTPFFYDNNIYYSH